jgi:hypothetical protein
MLPNSAGSDAPARMDRHVLEALLELDEGWASDLQLSWEIAGPDLASRRQVRHALTVIGRSGALERIVARHREEPVPLTRVDHQAIREELEQDQ